MIFIKFSDNQKKELARWAKNYKIDKLQKIETFEGITELYCNNKQIDKIPKQIECLTNLEKLNLSYNNISNLPSELKNLENLKSLDLGYNNLQDFPECICHLNNLEYLNLEANNLKKIHSSIGKLRQLKELNLFANRIISLPENFGSLNSLTILNLALNQLSSLPYSFKKLINISSLELWLNKFDSIPDIISELPNLKDLISAEDPEKLNKTLIWAVIGNNILLADKLIFYGANVNYQYNECVNQLFTTPLFEAKSLDMMYLLLNMGANPYLKREIIKHVVTKNGEEERPTGEFESFLTKNHHKEIQKIIKSYVKTNNPEFIEN